jgi:hypothetical protein
VIKCDASAPILITVDAPADTTVSINGQPFEGGQFSTSLTRDVGQSFVIVVQSPTALTTHFVRCLPADFPDWTAQRTGETQAEYYATTTPWSVPAFQSRPVIFDNNGVPVWWSNTTNTYFTTVLQDPNDNNNPKVAWTFQNGAGAQEHNLDGSVYHTVNTAPSGSDPHDLLALNGKYVMVENVSVPHQNLTACGGTNDETLIDQVIEEITPQGVAVPFWDTMTHIPVSETDPQWYGSNCQQGDAYHWNSIERTSDGDYILSFRHLDAIYRIDGTTGAIEWKLGGTPRAESLTVQQDPVFTGGSHFGGQHDARLLSDGTVTLHDNGTNLDRAPRAVRYQIDATNKTATLVESHDDALMPASNCCGSARKLSGGDWVMGWGGTQGSARVGTEMTDSGSRVFLLQFSTSGGMYRFTPVLPGVLDRNAIRAGMDTQYNTPPIGTATSGASASTKSPATPPPAPQTSNPQVDQP